MKNANGCPQTAAVTINNEADGPLFTAVRIVIQSRCISCHSGARQVGKMNWEEDPCNIVS